MKITTSLLIIVFSVCLYGFSNHVSSPDCPKLSVSEQGDVLNQFFSDFEEGYKIGIKKEFYESLKTYGYCPGQFGLKTTK